MKYVESARKDILRELLSCRKGRCGYLVLGLSQRLEGEEMLSRSRISGGDWTDIGDCCSGENSSMQFLSQASL
jgi:hypothetical protein